MRGAVAILTPLISSVTKPKTLIRGDFTEFIQITILSFNVP